MNKTLNKEGFALRRKKIPMRMCVGCREMKSKIELIRVVKSPEGDISIDDKRGKKPGRGAYICRNSTCMEKVKKSRVLERTFNQKIDDEIYDMLILAMNEGEGN